jgi:hypothetical protein
MERFNAFSNGIAKLRRPFATAGKMFAFKLPIVDLRAVLTVAESSGPHRTLGLLNWPTLDLQTFFHRGRKHFGMCRCFDAFRP